MHPVRECTSSLTPRHISSSSHAPPQGLSLSWVLAQALSRILGSPSVTLPLAPFLDAGLANGSLPDTLDLQALVLPGSYDPRMELACQAGQLGQPLLPSDEAAAELRPLRRFHAGEVVAIKHHDLISATSGGSGAASASALAARAAERRSTQPFPSSPPASESSSLVYARVAASCAPQEGEVLYRVPLEADNGEGFSLLSSQVFSFTHRQMEEGDAAHDPPAALVSVNSWMAVQQGESQSSQSAVEGHPSGLHSLAPPSAVSSASYVSAVKDLLAAAGLPLDLDRAKLVEEATLLRETNRVQKQALGQVSLVV